MAAQSTVSYAKVYSDSKIKEATHNNSQVFNNIYADMSVAYMSTGKKVLCFLYPRNTLF